MATACVAQGLILGSVLKAVDGESNALNVSYLLYSIASQNIVFLFFVFLVFLSF